MPSGILIGGSPSKALLAEPDQTWPKERSRLTFTDITPSGLECFD